MSTPKSEKQTFVYETAPTLLMEQLTPESKGLWGMMGPQHMLEHLSALLYIASGKSNVSCHTPEDKLHLYLAWLKSDKPFKRNYKAPIIPEGKTFPLRYANMEEAKERFVQSMAGFKQKFEENPQGETTHPVFGNLSLELWEQFHFKHFTHHLTQFGLLENTDPHA